MTKFGKKAIYCEALENVAQAIENLKECEKTLKYDYENSEYVKDENGNYIYEMPTEEKALARLEAYNEILKQLEKLL